ncbi:MAG: LysR family transcriptional regulator [Lachnospiraceae bacterium]|nr:LysR family transcriptional regulator [Lachnospiraceae bacterium]
MDINYELYKVFYYVGKTLSFSEASKCLFISQSAVSQSIKVLEKRLDTVLFIRSTKKVSLTREGEILFKHVESAINLLTRGENQLCEAENEKKVQLRIAASNSISKNVLLPYINEFHKNNKDAHIKIFSCDANTGAKLLEEDKVDVAFASTVGASFSNHNVITLKTFQDVFVANKEFFPLEDRVLKMEELVEYPILMMNKEDSSNEFLHSHLLKNSVDLVPDMELNSNELLIDLAKVGMGIAFVPEFCLNHVEDDENMIKVDIMDNVPTRKIVVATKDEGENMDVVNKFIDVLNIHQLV